MQSLGQRLKHNPIRNRAGFMVADFIFSFVMVIGIGIFLFGLTFSLATIEVAQYIVWSTARNYSAANNNPAAAEDLAREKFENLGKQFPLLTGMGDAESPWFELKTDDLKIGNLADGSIDPEFSNALSADDLLNAYRQPWTGASAKISLILFSNLQIPFLGKVAEDKSAFTFPVRAFIIRHPSRDECRTFFYGKRYAEGIKTLENSTLAPESGNDLRGTPVGNIESGFGEDNGC